MVHVLLKYDVQIDDPSAVTWIEYGISMMVNPMAKMRVKRREEINLETLVGDQ